MGVCRRWHQLMKASPELWTSYTVGNPWGDESEANVIMPSRELLDIWQERSKNRPVDLHLYSGSFAAQIDDNMLLMIALLPSINRWSQIDIAFDERTAEAFLNLDHPGHGVREIRVSSFCGPEINDQLLMAIGQWPHLEKLVWIFAAGLPITNERTFHNTLCFFPWEHLHHISLEVSWTLTEFRSFFSSSTSAQTIRLNMQQHLTSSAEYDMHPIITLPELRYLGIESDSSIYHYIGCLNLTGIQYLALFPKIIPLEGSSGWGAQTAVVPNQKFVDFLIRTARSAQAMIVHGCQFSGSSAVHLFSDESVLRVPVLEIEVGELAATAVIEYINLNSSVTAYHQAGLVSWCYDDTSCHALRNIFPSFSFNYHSVP